MLTLLLLAISFHTNFEAGNIGKVETVAENHYRCKVPGESDQKLLRAAGPSQQLDARRAGQYRGQSYPKGEGKRLPRAVSGSEDTCLHNGNEGGFQPEARAPTHLEGSGRVRRRDSAGHGVCGDGEISREKEG